MLLKIFLLIVGLVAIVKSADILISSSSSLARKLKIPAFIVGIVIVAFGTSAPELVIGIMSGVSKTNQLTLGNIIGSGFSNIAFILGISAIILPLKTEASIVKKEIPMLFGVELLLFGLLFFDNKLSLVDGIILVICFVAFMTYITIKAKFEQREEVKESTTLPIQKTDELQENTEDKINCKLRSDDIVRDSVNDDNGEIVKNEDCELLNAEESEKPSQLIKKPDEQQDRWIKIIPMLILSLAGLFIGGKLTVDYSSSIALSIGLSETFIGITVVAIATTLPELVASVAAARKKEAGIVLGNCIGSNIFNILLVVGCSTIINPIPYDSSLTIDFILVISLTFMVFLIALIRKKLSRIIGIILLSGYVLYIVFKILSITVLSGII